MATSDVKNTNPDAPAGAEDPVLSISDFCVRLSESVSKPELIGAFAHVEQKAQRTSDTQASYRKRFDAFINKPV